MLNSQRKSPQVPNSNPGFVASEPCAFCGNPESQAHHPSYNTPLRVTWLCKQCHPLHHHRLWAALQLIAKTGRAAQLELFPRSWLASISKGKGDLSPNISYSQMGLLIHNNMRTCAKSALIFNHLHIKMPNCPF